MAEQSNLDFLCNIWMVFFQNFRRDIRKINEALFVYFVDTNNEKYLNCCDDLTKMWKRKFMASLFFLLYNTKNLPKKLKNMVEHKQKDLNNCYKINFNVTPELMECFSYFWVEFLNEHSSDTNRRMLIGNVIKIFNNTKIKNSSDYIKTEILKILPKK